MQSQLRQLSIGSMFGTSSSRVSFPTVSIVGSAGRRGDGKKMTKLLFNRMVEKAKEVITRDFKLDLDKIHLVSGGAAWSDHIAVVLYLHQEVGSLTLHFPVEWEHTKFKDNDKDIWKNPGRSANKLHKQFSNKLEEDTLAHINAAIILGTRYYVHDGFQKRNTEVAKSEYLIAFTWGESFETQKRGGTKDTWTKCTGNKIYIPLHTLEDKVIQEVPEVSQSVPSRKRLLDSECTCISVVNESKKLKL